MTKRLCYIALVALSALMVCSCTDSDLDPTPAPEKSEGVDYLVMHYSVGGSNLDDGIMANIMQALDEGSNEKVKMTFQCKMSDSLQRVDALKDFHGTRRIVADDNAHLRGQFVGMTENYPYIELKNLSRYTSKIKSEKIGDAKYNMTNSEALADFIKWSKAKYPNAKRTILILSDHGGAWSLGDDGKADTRAMLRDDNCDNELLSLHDVVNGVNNGGGVDVLYNDACLMSTFENLYGYTECVKYVMASFEVAPGYGGDYRVLTKLLKLAGTEEGEMENTLKRYVDYCTSHFWWGSNSENYHDLALYDLSKIGNLTVAIKNIADKLAELYVTEERIDMEEGAEIEPGVSLGDRYPAYLNYAMSECLVSYTQMNIKADSIPEIIQEFMEADGLVAEDNEYNSANVIKWIRYGQTVNAQLAYENYPVEWKKMEQQIISLNFTTSYSLTSILLGLINSFSAIEAAENPFIKLHNDLIEAIASMGYIRCTKEKDMNNGLSFAYEFCTPGILLVPFNELYYNEDNYVNQFVPELNDALRYYQNTEFDQKVGWSRVLKLIDIVPSAFTNPMRENMFNMEPEQGVK